MSNRQLGLWPNMSNLIVTSDEWLVEAFARLRWWQVFWRDVTLQPICLFNKQNLCLKAERW